MALVGPGKVSVNSSSYGDGACKGGDGDNDFPYAQILATINANDATKRSTALFALLGIHSLAHSAIIGFKPSRASSAVVIKEEKQTKGTQHS